MSSRLGEARRRFQGWLTPEQQRGVRMLAWASVVSLGGVTVTGIWQFFTHESAPGWYRYTPGAGVELPSPQTEGAAELHGLFAASVASIALFGGGWIAYRVLYDIPWPAVGVLVLAVIGLVNGSVMRFNLVKLRGQRYEDAGQGYWQIFGRDLEFVVTDRFELGPTAIRLWTMGHVLTLPILLAVIWLGFSRADEANPEREVTRWVQD